MNLYKTPVFRSFYSLHVVTLDVATKQQSYESCKNIKNNVLLYSGHPGGSASVCRDYTPGSRWVIIFIRDPVGSLDSISTKVDLSGAD